MKLQGQAKISSAPIAAACSAKNKTARNESVEEN